MSEQTGAPDRTLEVMMRQESQPVEGRQWDSTEHMNVSVLQGFMEKHRLDEMILRIGTTLTHYRWAEASEPSGAASERDRGER